MDFKEGLEPVSPNGQYFNSSVLSMSVIVVLEFEVPINDLPLMSLLNVNGAWLPINPRFSFVMLLISLKQVRGTKGEKQWKRVEVEVQDHIKTPIFPTGLSPESYDEYLDDYITNIAMDQFPQNKPLREIHYIQCPTSKAASNLIFKFHHALGDGYSLTGLLLSCLQRDDNPSLPLTFASRQRLGKESHDQRSIYRMVPQFLSSIFNTIYDHIWLKCRMPWAIGDFEGRYISLQAWYPCKFQNFGWSVLKSNFVEDDQSPIRSGGEGVEFRPMTISTVTFSLDHIKFIKSRPGVTINDVITGIIFYGTRLYMQEISHNSSKAQSIAVVLLSTRTVSGYKSVQEMVKPGSDAPWGNKFSFLHIPIPKFTDLKSLNPTEFVLRAHNMIKKKKSSSAISSQLVACK
ncbi:wax ester synthase/diacylglycerol acyltransferase 11-like [Quercus robur]|uniref:wax ester synthase/diacylglycerol acyltransferase 11-like n=1 Tax=Quercus robur TaxID=38942 RepID=UPI0021630A95|nr:wax ester synthase/diacylglycerol acyltransferase 11-like [Quercus robur]